MRRIVKEKPPHGHKKSTNKSRRSKFFYVGLFNDVEKGEKYDFPFAGATSKLLLLRLH